MSPRSPRPLGRVVLLAGFAFGLMGSAASRGQAPSSPDTALARYVPKDEVLMLVEFDGLDAHAEAWKKTAAYKILVDTKVGSMLEDVAAQVLDRVLAAHSSGLPARKGADVVLLIKHLARSGFLVAVVGDKEKPENAGTVVVYRNAFKDKDIRALMARGLQEANAPNSKPQVVVRAGHKVISGVTAAGTGYAWWVEESKKEDIVQVFPSAEIADAVLETLDGKRESAATHPRRIELFQPENGFIPDGIAFAEPKPFSRSPGSMLLGIGEFSKFDLRWGFQDEALMTIARIVTPSPHKGVPGLLEGSTFEKGKLPPIPDSVKDFSAASFDLNATLEKGLALAKSFRPEAEVDFAKFADSFKARTKLRFREDLLAHLGPKMAWYVLPQKAETKASTPGPNLFGAMMAGAGLDHLPRLAVVMDVDNPVAFGKVLDEAIVAANRELKAMGRPPGEPAPRAGRSKNAGPPAPEFRPVPGDAKMYALNVPTDLAGQYPPGFRPAIRVGPKQVAIGVSAEVVKAALEPKGPWTPPADLAAAYQGVGSKLKFLSISDPRASVPAFLSALPAKVQAAFNSAMLLNPASVPAATPTSSPTSPTPAAGGFRKPASSAEGPGAATPAAGGAATPTGAAGTLVLQVDAAKLPSADAIKALLFPSLFSIESSGEEIRIVSRFAFPDLGDPSKTTALMGLVGPMLRGAGGLPPGTTPPPGAAPGVGAGRAGPEGTSPAGGSSRGRPQ